MVYAGPKQESMAREGTDAEFSESQTHSLGQRWQQYPLKAQEEVNCVE